MGQKIGIESIANGFIVDTFKVRRYGKLASKGLTVPPDLVVVKTFAGTHREVTKLVKESLLAIEVVQKDNPGTYGV